MENRPQINSATSALGGPRPIVASRSSMGEARTSGRGVATNQGLTVIVQAKQPMNPGRRTRRAPNPRPDWRKGGSKKYRYSGLIHRGPMGESEREKQVWGVVCVWGDLSGRSLGRGNLDPVRPATTPCASAFAPATPTREGRRQHALAPKRPTCQGPRSVSTPRQRQPTTGLLIAWSPRTKIHSGLNSSHDSVGTRSGSGLRGGEAGRRVAHLPRQARSSIVPLLYTRLKHDASKPGGPPGRHSRTEHSPNSSQEWGNGSFPFASMSCRRVEGTGGVPPVAGRSGTAAGDAIDVCICEVLYAVVRALPLILTSRWLTTMDPATLQHGIR